MGESIYVTYDTQGLRSEHGKDVCTSISKSIRGLGLGRRGTGLFQHGQGPTFLIQNSCLLVDFCSLRGKIKTVVFLKLQPTFVSLFVILFSETGSSVQFILVLNLLCSLAGLELSMILLPQPLQFCGNRCVSPHPVAQQLSCIWEYSRCRLLLQGSLFFHREQENKGRWICEQQYRKPSSLIDKFGI